MTLKVSDNQYGQSHPIDNWLLVSLCCYPFSTFKRG